MPTRTVRLVDEPPRHQGVTNAPGNDWYSRGCWRMSRGGGVDCGGAGGGGATSPTRPSARTADGVRGRGGGGAPTSSPGHGGGRGALAPSPAPSRCCRNHQPARLHGRLQGNHTPGRLSPLTITICLTLSLLQLTFSGPLCSSYLTSLNKDCSCGPNFTLRKGERRQEGTNPATYLALMKVTLVSSPLEMSSRS